MSLTRAPVTPDVAPTPTESSLADRESQKGVEEGVTLSLELGVSSSAEDDGRGTEKPGLKSWMNVLGAFLVGTITYGATNSFGVFQAYYQTHQLHLKSPSTISWIGSIQLFLVLLLGCISGPLFDSGHLRILLISGATIYTTSLILTSFSDAYWEFLVCHGIMNGVGMGLMFAPSMSAVGAWSGGGDWAIVALGIACVGPSLGGVVFPIMLRSLFEKVGFAWAVRILALIVLILSIISFLCLTSKNIAKKSLTILSLSVFRSKTYNIVVAGSCAVALGLYGPFSFGVIYAEAHGLTKPRSFYSLSTLNGICIIGKLVASYLAQRYGTLTIMIVSTTLSGTMLFCWTSVTTPAAIFVYNALYGFASGGAVALFYAAVTSLEIDSNQTGLYLGMALFTSSFFWLASGPLVAALIGVGLPDDTPKDDGRLYLPASVFCGLVVLLGAGLLGVGWRMRRQGLSTWRV